MRRLKQFNLLPVATQARTRNPMMSKSSGKTTKLRQKMNKPDRPCAWFAAKSDTKKAASAWAVGRVGRCWASSRMRMRYNCYCTQCPSSDIHLRLAFPLAVCINSIRKPLATQTIHFEAHPNVTRDLTDNARLIRGKTHRLCLQHGVLVVEPLLSSRLAAPVQSSTRDLQLSPRLC